MPQSEIRTELNILATTTLKQHLTAYAENRQNYVESVTKIMTSSVYRNVPSLNKAFILTTLLYGLEQKILEDIHEHIDLPEMLKACQILDSGRLCRRLYYKLSKHRNIGKHKTAFINSEIKRLCEEKKDTEGIVLSLTRTRAKFVNQWLYRKSANELEFAVAFFSAGSTSWKMLADLTHPSSLHLQLPWFLNYWYGAPAPETSVASKIARLTLDNFAEIYSTMDIPYKTLRLKIDFTPKLEQSSSKLNAARAQIVAKENLTTVLWYYNELITPVTAQEIYNRLKVGESVDLNYGKLVDLLITVNQPNIREELIRIAENKLAQYECAVAGQILVLGDASGSMEVAIKTSSIITSILCAVGKAQLSLFAGSNRIILSPPRTVREALQFARTMRADGCTCPASSMGHYLENRVKFDTIIVVTDEEENTADSTYNSRFAPLYHRYINTVYRAKLIFVSFTSPTTDGTMTIELKHVLDGETYKELVTVHKYYLRNPDLNRLDCILATLGSSSTEGTCAFASC